MTKQLPGPAVTLTLPVGAVVPLAAVTDTDTVSVVPCGLDACVVPVIAVVVPTLGAGVVTVGVTVVSVTVGVTVVSVTVGVAPVLGPANAVPGISRTPPTTPPVNTTPAAMPAARSRAVPMSLCIDMPFRP